MRNLTISGYTTLRLLGEGGMSTVWYAENRLKRPAAIKFLKPELLVVPAVRQRFSDEAAALTQLNHPNIRAVLDYEETESHLAIVLEYLDGQDLGEWIAEHGPASPADAQKWMSQALNALQMAHNQGIVHRDIKPANLFLTRSGDLKILDFGIAKIVGSDAGLTRTNRAIGSPMYMSPEQVRTPKDVDHRSDLYSLGVTLHALLAGRKPYDEETESEFDILQKVVQEPLPPIRSLSAAESPEMAAFSAIIARATAKNRNDRYPDCAAFAADIQGVKVGSLPKATDLPPKKPKQDETLVEGIAVPPAPKKREETLLDMGVETPANQGNKAESLPKPPDPAPKEQPVINREPGGADVIGPQKPITSNSPNSKRLLLIGSAAALAVVALLLWQPWKGSPQPTPVKQDTIVTVQPAPQPVQPQPTTTAATTPTTAQATPAPAPEPAKSAITPELQAVIDQIARNMVRIPGGTFQMGSDVNNDEKPIHTVSVGSFSMSSTEVTQAQYKAVMGSNPSHFKGCDQCPVENVSWNDAQAFIKKLNSLTGKSYRLPTEAEWEYAAGGGNGSRTKYGGTNSEGSLGSYAWYEGNSGSKTHPVKGKSPNALGLYDMSGNVWEWCQDWYDANYYKNSPSSNPINSTSSTYRVLRGGSWYNFTNDCRVANRDNSSPDFRNDYVGFRLALPQD